MNNKIVFAAGCFWGVEDLFAKTEGVIETCVGYTGGHVEIPTYKLVCEGQTGHAEAVEVTFNSQSVSLEQLCTLFWENHNPTQLNAQGPDVGTQYRSAVFYFGEEQKQVVENTKKIAQQNWDSPIVTEVNIANTFYPAEEYHQKYFEKKGISHCRI